MKRIHLETTLRFTFDNYHASFIQRTGVVSDKQQPTLK